MYGTLGAWCALDNAEPGDVIVLKKSLVIDFHPNNAPPSRTTFPKGHTFVMGQKIRNVEWPRDYVPTTTGLIYLPDDRYSDSDRSEYRNVVSILSSGLVIKRSLSGNEVKRSAVAHKDAWKTAEAGAEIASYVIADEDGKRLRIPANKLVENNTGYEYKKITVPEAKKHPNIGRAKQRVLYLVGYYNRFGDDMGMLNNPDPAFQEWDKKWFVWSADKNGCIIEKVLNCREYTQVTTKYAALSMRYGTECRDLFKKIEKSTQDYFGVILFGVWGAGYSDNRVEMDRTHIQHDGQLIGDSAGFKLLPDLVREVKSVIPKGALLRSGRAVIAAALPTVSDAMMTRLAYQGPLDVRVIDLVKMEELVGKNLTSD